VQVDAYKHFSDICCEKAARMSFVSVVMLLRFLLIKSKPDHRRREVCCLENMQIVRLHQATVDKTYKYFF